MLTGARKSEILTMIWDEVNLKAKTYKLHTRRTVKSLSQVQQFLRHDHKNTTELYTGHLDNSTSKQSEYLGNFWREKLAEAADAK